MKYRDKETGEVVEVDTTGSCMSEQLPQWAVDDGDVQAAIAMENLLAMADQTAEDRGVWLSEFLARALADAAKPKWRTDMENAPRDGTRILIYADGEQFVAFWDVRIEEGVGEWVIARSPVTAFVVRNPTHWMPLPAAPALTQVEQQEQEV